DGQNLSIWRANKPERRPKRPARRLQRSVAGPICPAGGTFRANNGPNCPAGGLVRSGSRPILLAGRQIWSGDGKIRAARRLFRATGQQKGPANGALEELRAWEGPCPPQRAS